MNKNRSKAIFFSLAVALFAFSTFLAPLAEAVTVGNGGGGSNNYVEIPLAPYSRPDVGPLIVSTACGGFSDFGKCKEVSAEPGMYNFVGKTVRIEPATITGVEVMTQSRVNDGYVPTTNFAFNRDPLGESIRVYGLSANESYKIAFTFDDSKTSDITTLVSQVSKLCPVTGTGGANSTAHNIAFNLVNGCVRYNSAPFLPAAIAGTEANTGLFFKYNGGPQTLGATTIKPPPSTAPTNRADASNPDTCMIPATASMRWLECPMLGWGEDATNALDSLIQNFLFAPTEQIFSPQMKSAWNSFRIMGVVLVLIAGLTMVISQAMGLEIFDAYTVKKVLPRLLIAAIGISLSWPILQFVITFFNDLGVWSHDIILFPFKALDNNAGGSIIAGGIGITASIPLAIALMGPAIFPLLGTIVLGLLIALVVLTLRQLVIIVAVLLAPLAIAAYILPGTQKLWEFWKNTFLTTLYMFPIIMAFIASGKALALVAAGVKDNPQLHVLSVVAYFAPYFLLPFAFKLAGGLMATVFSVANDKNRGAFDRLRKARQGMGAQHRERTITRPTLQARANVQRSLMAKSSKTRVGGAALRGLARGVGGYNLEARMSALNASVGKELGDQIATGNDASIRGSTVDLAAIKSMGWSAAQSQGLAQIGKDGKTRQYKSLGGAWVDEADVMDGHRRWGGDVAAQQAALSYEMRKAMTDDQVGGISERYSSLAKNQWKMTSSEATGAWIGAGFENQNHHLEYKNTDWGSDGILSGKAGTLNAEKFSKEAYEQKGSYQMSQMSAHTITQLKNAYDTAGQTGDTATQQRIQAVAETFMSRYGSGSGGMNEVGGDMVPTRGGPPGTERSASYQTNAQGSGHVAEAVRDLAVHVGVYQEPDPTTRTTSPGPAPPMPRQN